MTVVTELLDTIPNLCAEKITSEVCKFVHDDFSSDIRTRIADYMGNITLPPEMLMDLIHKLAPVYKKTGGGGGGGRNSKNKSKRCRSMPPNTTNKTRHVYRGGSLEGGDPPKGMTALASVASNITSGASIPSVAPGATTGNMQVLSASSAASSIAHVFEQALTDAVAKISDPIFAKVKTDLTKLFDEDKEKVTGMVKEGFARLFERIAKDPRTMGIFREKLGARVDALLANTKDPVVRAIVVDNKCPTDASVQAQNKMNLYDALKYSKGANVDASRAKIISDMVATKAVVDKFLAENNRV